MTDRTARPRARFLAALAAGTAAVIALSGCTLIEELTATGVDEGGDDGMVLVDESTAPDALGFFEQEIDWQACDASLTAPEDYECATVQAPMDWSAPGERDPIDLFLVKRPADGASQGTLFTNPGGPGASGADFVAMSADYFFSADLRENYDIVGWDPRGVGRSSAVECRDDEGMDDYFYGVPDGADSMTPEEWNEWGVEQAIAFGRDCAMNTGELLGFVDTASTVQDLDLLRALVGDTKLAYFGLSYGTDIGAQYIDRYPERVGRIVLDGATDPTVPMFDVVIDQQQKFGDATRNYLRDCFSSADCPYRSTDVDGAIAEMQAVMDEVDRTLPKNHDGRVLTSGVVQMAITVSMYDSSSWQYLSMAFADWFDSADPQLFFLLSDSYYGRDMDGHYDSNMFEAFAAINCLDYPLITDPDAIRDFHERLE
ncbi:MAG: alpha/beta hydrolase, partial [Microbacteriaceae bacterium]|nr:alpha/beta hydrolase [Microbacteriaceae bacterium]